MNDEIKDQKQIMKTKRAPYQAYNFCIGVPIVLIFQYILAFLGIETSSLGAVMFAFTVMAHVQLTKLKRLSNKKYIAPILMYINEIIGIVIILPALISNSDITLPTVVVLIIQIVALVLFFITAKNIKKAYPTMQKDAVDATQEYKILKKEKK